jgi:hypothetical protein
MGLAAIAQALTRKADYRLVFGTPAGRRVLADLYRECGMNAQLHVPGDPFSTAFNTGKHRIGQRIAGLLGEPDDKVRKRLAEEEPYGEEANHV